MSASFPPATSRSLVLLALGAFLLPWGGSDALAAADSPFAGLQPMSANELARYRGGFVTINGWELAFSVKIDINIDDSFRTTTWLSPLANLSPEVAPPNVTVPTTGIRIGADGVPVRVSQPAAPRPDVPEQTQSAAASPVNGIEIEGTGFPVQLDQSSGGIVQKVGTADTTLVETVVNLNRISQIVANTRNNASIQALTTLTIDLLNHSDRIRATAGTRNLARLLGGLGRDLGTLRR